MRAAVTRGGDLVLDEIGDPRPGDGHVLVRSLAAGICGSDLHMLADAGHVASVMRRTGAPAFDPGADVVFGHEFCAEVVEHGPATERALPAGSRVCSFPVILTPGGVEQVGYSNTHPGALAEYFMLQEALLLPVPDGLPTELAALTEPLAVGEHAVCLADPAERQPCLVVGCGPVGLAVIAALKARSLGPVIAADLSPARRRLAEWFGADEIVDPAEHSPHDRWTELGVPTSVLEHAAVSLLGGSATRPVIFEAVGIPAMLQSLIEEAPPHSRIVVVGVCMQPDVIEPLMAVVKEIELRFSFGYSVQEFAATLGRLADGVAGADRLVTASVPLEEAPAAFDMLRDPVGHGKILVTP